MGATFNRLVRAATTSTLSGAATTFTSPIGVDSAKLYVNLFVNVSAVGGTSPSLALTVQWSNDGTNWAALDGTAETFAALTAVGTVVKQFTVKAPLLRLKEVLTGTSPTATYTCDLYCIDGE